MSSPGFWRVISAKMLAWHSAYLTNARGHERTQGTGRRRYTRLLPNCVPLRRFQCRSCINRNPGRLVWIVYWAGEWIHGVLHSPSNRNLTHQPSASLIFGIHFDNRESGIGWSRKTCTLYFRYPVVICAHSTYVAFEPDDSKFMRTEPESPGRSYGEV